MSTEIVSTNVEELRARLRRAEELLDLLLTRNPDGILILDAEGRLTVNPAAELIAHPGASPTQVNEIQSTVAIYQADGKTRLTEEQLPNLRALRGETLRDEVYMIRSPSRGDVWVQCNAVGVDGGRRSLMVFRDITDRKKLEEDLARRNAELNDKAEENQRLVARLRVALDQLSTPVLELWEDVLALPVIGIVDTQRSVQMAEKLLKEVSESGARYVIIDLTGVDIVDTSTADRLIKLSRAVSLLGAECVVSGLQPDVAQTLIQLGVELGGMKTQRNLKHALDAFLSRGEGVRHA